MICKKCGREYEDDMTNCLWCDAVNEEHPDFKKNIPPESPKAPEVTSVFTPQDNSSEEDNRNPAGLFMWSSFIFGLSGLGYIFVAIIQTFLHHKVLQETKSSLSFFLKLFVANLALYFLTLPVTIVITDIASKHPQLSDSTKELIPLLVSIGYATAQGFISAKIINAHIPDYDVKTYRKKEHIAIGIAIIVFIISAIVIAVCKKS